MDVVWEYDGLLDTLKEEGYTESQISTVKTTFLLWELLEMTEKTYFNGEFPSEIIDEAKNNGLIEIIKKKKGEIIRVTPMGSMWAIACLQDETTITYSLLVQCLDNDLKVAGFKDGQPSFSLTEHGKEKARKLIQEMAHK